MIKGKDATRREECMTGWRAYGRLVLLAAGLIPCSAAGAQERPLRWGADEEGGAPYVFKDPTTPSGLAGFEVDLARALEMQLGRPIRFVHYEFNTLIQGVLRGDLDFAMNGLEVLPERAKVVRFSRPYYVYQLQLATRADDHRFTSLADFQGVNGVTVGTLENTAAERILRDRKIPTRAFPGQAELYKLLSRGELDAVYLDLPVQNYFLPLYPDLRLRGQPRDKGYYAAAFRKEDAALADAFDAALGRLLENGELRDIYEKWKLWNADQKELTNPEVAGADDPGAAWTFGRYFPMLLRGAGVTVEIAVLGMLLAVTLGLPVALARMYGPAPLRWLALGYVEFFRGIPVLLLLYFLYYGLPDVAASWGLPLRMTALEAAVLGFGINYAAYEAEIYRAGIAAVPAGQWEAAASLGMSGPLTFRRIILPQALRTILPPMTNDFVALFKDTSVVSIIAVVELSKEYQTLSKTSMKYVEIGLVTAALYLIMSVPLGYLSRYLEKRWSAATG
jgi:polar amino acid transport system substrate-binding protein